MEIKSMDDNEIDYSKDIFVTFEMGILMFIRKKFK